jgi:hypothetical protein
MFISMPDSLSALRSSGCGVLDNPLCWVESVGELAPSSITLVPHFSRPLTAIVDFAWVFSLPSLFVSVRAFNSDSN